MNPKLLSTFALALAVCFAVANAAGEGTGETGGEDGEKQMDAVAPLGDDMMAGDTDAAKHKGFCHWGVAVWYKAGFSLKCNCMKCTCQIGGNWKCDYNFAFCPYFYCGNVIYNPHTSLCCCGRVHDKKADHKCCGYYYYNKNHSQCCNYYSVKPIKSHCPRDRV